MLTIGTAMRISNSKITAPLCTEDGSWERVAVEAEDDTPISSAGCFTTLLVSKIHNILG
jgi:hypothetical protein